MLGDIRLKLAIIGSRSATYKDYKTITDNIPKNCSEIISGGAKGVDSLAEKFATDNKLCLVKILPNYEKHGKSAALIRNDEIVKRVDFILCFWDGTSRGTQYVMKKCIELKKPFKLIYLNKNTPKQIKNNSVK